MNDTIRTLRRFFVLGLILLAPFFVAQPFAQAQPVIDALDPSTAQPGGQYTITGSGFTPTGNDILWDGVVQLRKQSTTGTSIDDVAVPQGTALGNYAVTVRNSNGESTARTLTVGDDGGVSPPQIDSLDPSMVQPGAQYTITGSGFTSTGNDILWDGVFQLRRQSLGGTSIDNVPVPQGTASGDYNVTVQNINGESTALTLEVIPGGSLPQIDSLDPATVQPGGQYTITGSGFTPTGNDILWDGVFQLRRKSPTGTSIDNVPVPQGTAPGDYEVTVKNSNGESAAMTLMVEGAPPPQIDSLNPSTVQPGGQYTITGSGFTPTGNDILWDGVFQLRRKSPTGTSIDNVPVPQGTTPDDYDVAVRNSNGESNALILEVIPGGSLPQIDSLDPSTVPPGGQYTITGSGFTPTGNDILWDGVFQVRRQSPDGTSIDNVPVPLGTAPGDYNVTVRTSNGESAARTLAVIAGDPLPQIDSLDPSTVPPGGQYTITGSGFTPTGNDILWDGVVQVRKQSPTGTSIDNVAVPQGTATGNYEITVKNNNGESAARTLTVE